MALSGGWNTHGIVFRPEAHLKLFHFSKKGRRELPLETLESGRDLGGHNQIGKSCVLVLESRGGKCAVIGATENFVRAACTTMRFPDLFLKRMFSPGSLSRLDYLLERSPAAVSTISNATLFVPAAQELEN